MPLPISSVAALAATLTACTLVAGCEGGTAARRTLALAECRLPRLAVAAQCGTLEVPENRAAPGGRKLDLFVAVLPANTVAPKEDPLFILAGGPGQAASQLAPLAQRLSDVRRTRDIVLVDQRGTGRSSPLTCETFKPSDDVAQSFDTDSVQKAQACLAELAARGVDVAQYTTDAWVADLDAVRAALGYPRVNLWGGSYGTRVALAYLRRHPDRVRTMVLDGVAWPGMVVPRDVWPSRDDALEAVVTACAASAACSAQHRDLGVTLRTLERELAPPGRVVGFADPRTGKAREARLTFDIVLGALYGLTYAPERAALIPEVVERTAAGDYGPLFAAAQAAVGDIGEQLTPALHYAVICSEDAPRVTVADRAALDQRRSRELARNMLDVCAIWPRGTVPADSVEPVASDVPTLLLSGALDPVTPPAGAAAVASTLPQSRHVVATGLGHIVSGQSCVPRMIAAFVDAGATAALPAACVDFLADMKRSPLWPDRLGPQP